MLTTIVIKAANEHQYKLYFLFLCVITNFGIIASLF